MKVETLDATFEIDDILIDASPVLKAMRDIPMGKDEAFDVEAEPFSEYVRFLMGEDFRMNEDVASVFDYMGHQNNLSLNLETWKVKLRDNWIRDMFYRLELWRDPLYGLRQVSIVHRLKVPIPDGWYVAGGAALWMAGYIDKFSDVDLFTCMSKEEANASLAFLNEPHPDIPSKGKHRVSVSGNSISWMYSDRYDSEGTPISPTKVQFILRTYRAPTEIVHGFDLDCVGFLYIPGHMNADGSYVPEALYATQRALHSVQQGKNWFDPARASPTYAYRLVKYKGRGFDIVLPSFDEEQINRQEIDRYFEAINKAYILSNMSYYDEMISNDSSFEWEAGDFVQGMMQAVQDLHTNARGNIEMTPAALRQLLRGHLPRPETSNSHLHPGAKFKDIKPFIEVVNDPASLLILAVAANFYPSSFTTLPSDYETIKSTATSSDDRRFIIQFDRLNWRELDPMSQLTGTFCPEPVEDMGKFYSTSRFYGSQQEEHEYLSTFELGTYDLGDQPDEEEARKYSNTLRYLKDFYSNLDDVEMIPYDRAYQLWRERYSNTQ